ncbi:hypothetical protein MJG53_019418 [Ovis ammon polii x Ovis aries]|uniref:Uncharacterized protein n=1 Tax=Ovis ammon polii x Ovis aries TaxID=2918886 RepID=A0ACB9TZG4_9CETA|nr:hypothetical protein MJG53_019418 [Ovis ammon polii x Ovis aries]
MFATGNGLTHGDKAFKSGKSKENAQCWSYRLMQTYTRIRRNKHKDPKQPYQSVCVRGHKMGIISNNLQRKGQRAFRFLTSHQGRTDFTGETVLDHAVFWFGCADRQVKARRSPFSLWDLAGIVDTKRYVHLEPNCELDFPGGTVDKNPPADEGDMGLIPDLGRSTHFGATKPGPNYRARALEP